jgi:creatinine amidohydrolase
MGETPPPGRVPAGVASRWEEETFESIAAAFRAGAIAILPIGATEPHGPHLPIATDVVIAREMARRGAERLARRGMRVVILPEIAYSVADWAGGFAGGISLSPETARALVREVSVAAKRAGASLVVIANAHLEPAHLETIRAACREAGADAPVFPDVTRRRIAATLGTAFQAGDHAGGYETSLVLAARPDLVRESIRGTLAPVPGSLVEKIQQGARNFVEAGMTHAYTGDPAGASAEEGERLFERLASILEEAVIENHSGGGAGIPEDRSSR